MFRGLVEAAVFQANHRVLAERHQVTQQKPVGGMNFVFVALRLLPAARASRLSGEVQGHVQSAPIISATAPFLGSSAISLGCLAVVEEKAGIPLQGPELVPMREDE